MKTIKIVIVLVSILSGLGSFSQEDDLFGTYKVTFHCQGNKVGDTFYYTFDGEEMEQGYVEYSPTRSGKKYYPAFLGKYQITEEKVLIEITHDGAGLQLVRNEGNSSVETYTITRNYERVSSSDTEIVLKDKAECNGLIIKLKVLSEEEYATFLELIY